MKNTAFTAGLVAAALCAGAQAPSLVADIRPGTASSDASNFTSFNNKLYYIAMDDVNGSELWSYDGATAPALACNLGPGREAGAGYSYFGQMPVVGNKMFFVGNDGNTGFQLYQYTGSGAPTLAFNVKPGTMGSNISDMLAFKGKIYFSASSSGAGQELWAYDPATGAAITHDINPGANSSVPKDLVVFNDKLYFSGSNGATGHELMQYHPATNTVSVAQDLEAGPGSAFPTGLVVIGGDLYFTAQTAVYGRELYRYDGTTATRLTDLATGDLDGVQGDHYRFIAAYGNRIYFPGSTDGTQYQLYTYNMANGTTSIAYTLNSSGDGAPYGFTEYNGKMYFSADDGGNGEELWMHDGTNTAMVANLNPGNAGSQPYDLYVWNGSLYLDMTDGSTGYELYKLTTAAGINSFAFTGELKAFPNPATDFCAVSITLKQGQTISLALADATGREVFNTGAREMPVGKTVINLPVSRLATGNYFCTLRDDAGRIMASSKITRK